MNFTIQSAGPWGVVGVLVGVLVTWKVASGLFGDLRQLVDLLRIARDEEHEARIKAERQRDELLDQYAKTTVQVISALPVASAPGELVRALDPGGDPDAATVAP